MAAPLCVGFIGLGQIGAPMALRILGAGHRLVGHNRRPDGRPALEAAGARLSGSVAAVASEADVLCVNLFDDAQLRAVMLDDGALAALRPGTVVVVHTTGSPALLDDLSAAAPPGVDVLDACFSGTAKMTARGALVLLIGGEGRVLETARPILETYAEQIFHLGGLGAGRQAKLLNNLVFAANASLAAEAVTAAEAMGLDPGAFAQAVQRCSGSSYAMAAFKADPSVATVLDRFRPYLDKDVDAARIAARAEGIDLPLLSAAARWGAGA